LYTEDKSPFAYVDERFPRWEEYEDTIKKIENRSGIKEGEVKPKCRYTFIKHFYDKYGDSHQHLPFWMFIDLVDFSFLSFFLKNAEKKILARVAKDLDLAPRVLVTWLHTLNTLRNSCAHHSRVWNERWGTALMWPSEKGNREWYYVYSEELHKWILPKDRKSCQPSFPSYKTSALIFICRYLLKKIAPKSQWYRRVEKLFEEYANKQIDWKAMGFQTMDWQSHPLWRD
jgi:abortive infection bacteriophage resistance protein